MQHNAQEDSREHGITSLSAMKLITEGLWTPTQQRLLEVLQRQEYRCASIAQICQMAGYSHGMSQLMGSRTGLVHALSITPACNNSDTAH